MSTAPASLRSLTAAAFTGALAVAAHALAGGGPPTGAAATMLALVAAATGLFAGTDRLSRTPALIQLLAAGQLAAHTTLAVFGHAHASALTWELMATTHGLAVVVGAFLMSVAGRLASALSRAIRCCVSTVRAPAWPLRHVPAVWNFLPPQHLRLLADSISHRGPPGWAIS